MNRRDLSISIVSHGHKKHIVPLLADLAALGRSDIEVFITLNLPEDLGINYTDFPFPITLIRNRAQRSFAENHNAAFALSHGNYFVVLNPDVRLTGDPFDSLLATLRDYPDSVCAPLIMNKSGVIEDSARDFPTPLILLKKLVGKIIRIPLRNGFVPTENGLSTPDWVAGIFIVVPRFIYSRLRGLDERYRMYYEDVDFCARARLEGCKVMVNGEVTAIHEAQRDSHRNIRYLIWHLRSALRFFTSGVFFKVHLSRQLRAQWQP